MRPGVSHGLLEGSRSPPPRRDGDLALCGVTLTNIEDTVAVDRCTAQRMTKALEEMFPHCTTRIDDERRKFWIRLMLAQGIRDNELAALALSIRRAERYGAVTEVRALSGLRDRLLSATPGPLARRGRHGGGDAGSA